MLKNKSFAVLAIVVVLAIIVSMMVMAGILNLGSRSGKMKFWRM